MKKTIAVTESTWENLKKLMKEKHAKDFDELIRILVQKSEELPPSMFGIDRRLNIQYTQQEHEEFASDIHQ